MFDIDDVDEAKRMLPIYKRAVDLLETVSGKKTEQAEQEPVVKIHKYNEFQTLGSLNLPIGTKLYAAPVRTKDLTDDEIAKAIAPFQHEFIATGRTTMNFARAVIAADREKNK